MCTSKTYKVKIELTIPDSMSDLTLEQYQKFLKVIEVNDDEIFIRKKMVQIFCNVPLLDVDKMGQADFAEISEALVKVLDETPSLTRTFELNGVEYGFIPDFDKITLGEYVDLDFITGNWDEMVQFMSILYRPIKKKKKSKYKIEPYKTEKFDDFKDMPLDIVIGSQLFFWTIGNQLLKHIKSSSLHHLETPKVQQRLAETLVKDGVGTHQLVNSLDMMSQRFQKSLDKHFLPQSITLSI